MPHRLIISLPTSNQYFLPMQPWITLTTSLVWEPTSYPPWNHFLATACWNTVLSPVTGTGIKIFQPCSSISSNPAHVKCTLLKGSQAVGPMDSSEALYHSPQHKLSAVNSTGVYLHPGCGEWWWEQDHEPAPCEIPVSTLHWETGFLDIISFWDLSISWFLSLLIEVCNALCTEMPGVFQQEVIHYQMKCLTVSSLAMPLLLSVKMHLKEIAISSNTALCSFACTYKKAICKTLANKKIHSVI